MLFTHRIKLNRCHKETVITNKQIEQVAGYKSIYKHLLHVFHLKEHFSPEQLSGKAFLK